MSKKTKSVAFDRRLRALAERKQQEKEDNVTKMPLPDDLVVPDPLPLRGDTVILSYGNPHEIGSPVVQLVMVVTGVTEDGLVSGSAFTDPRMTAMDPRTGRPVQMQPIIPVGNVPYNPDGAKLSWCFVEEADALLNKAIEAVKKDRAEKQQSLKEASDGE